MVDVIDGVPLLTWGVKTTVPGWFTFLDAEEREAWREQAVEASVRIPPWVHVTTEDRLQLQDAPGARLILLLTPLGRMSLGRKRRS